jgi:hypothetical protein
MSNGLNLPPHVEAQIAAENYAERLVRKEQVKRIIYEIENGSYKDYKGLIKEIELADNPRLFDRNILEAVVKQKNPSYIKFLFRRFFYYKPHEYKEQEERIKDREDELINVLKSSNVKYKSAILSYFHEALKEMEEPLPTYAEWDKEMKLNYEENKKRHSKAFAKLFSKNLTETMKKRKELNLIKKRNRCQ